MDIWVISTFTNKARILKFITDSSRILFYYFSQFSNLGTHLKTGFQIIPAIRKISESQLNFQVTEFS